MTDRSGRALPLSMDRALEQYDSKFRFVLLASSRAEQLIRGARPKIEGAATRKHTRLAMEELKGGMIEWGYGPPPEAEPTEGKDTAAAAGDEAGGASEQ